MVRCDDVKEFVLQYLGKRGRDVVQGGTFFNIEVEHFHAVVNMGDGQRRMPQKIPGNTVREVQPFLLKLEYLADIVQKCPCDGQIGGHVGVFPPLLGVAEGACRVRNLNGVLQ